MGKYLTLDAKKNALAWVKALAAETMPSPEWVVDQFGIQGFNRASNPGADQPIAVIDKSEWLKKRMGMLKNMEDVLKVALESTTESKT